MVQLNTERPRIDYDGTVTEPAAPTREGFTFAGWESSGSAYDFSTRSAGLSPSSRYADAQQHAPRNARAHQRQSSPANQRATRRAPRGCQRLQ
ncbi:MAG: InlB B-repeat-containing protein [Ilumatobacteraceae bacterium]|nr:InlB B-repeat-containing protein [Ilumatobacteraceae bacterium]